MKLLKFDIGAEVISILTKGMYPDPRDAVREYIQNAVDAKAKNVSVNVRQSSVVVEDDGTGMDYATLRKAVRVGISDKRPGKDVGFMGIGIYSAFHLCDTLTIYTRKTGLMPQMLQMNFAEMRSVLKEQRDQRLNGEIDGDQLTDLQTLLESNIILPDEDALTVEEYPVENGTRVEIVGLDPILDDLLNDFDKLSGYLRNVVPLHFDSENFKWAELIETTIQKTCDANDAHFDLVNLKLGVSGRTENLYRPYKNSIFHDLTPRKPLFREIKKEDDFLGIAWGCLNSTRNRIGDKIGDKGDKEFRGFLLKKQGFTIGNRESLSHFFGPSSTHLDRYVGEVIVVNPDILPNAARNDLEYSSLKTWFDERMAKDVAPYYNGISNDFQEKSMAEELLNDLGTQLKNILIKFSPNEDNPDTLVSLIAEINSTIFPKIKVNKKGNVTRKERKLDFQQLLQTSKNLEKGIRDRLEYLFENQKMPEKSKQPKPTNQVSIAKELTQYTVSKTAEKFQSLIEIFDEIGIDYSVTIEKVLIVIDEKFIQGMAKNKSQYYRLLSEFKEEVENLDL